MKPKHQRLVFLLVGISIMAVAATSIFYSFRSNLVFFVTPTDLQKRLSEGTLADTQTMRLGGLVKEQSITQLGDNEITFILTDLTTETRVHYAGILPALFREGQGAVVEGTFSKNRFEALSLLAKHDENYMPAELVDALKKSGRWQHYGTRPSGKTSYPVYQTP